MPSAWPAIACVLIAGCRHKAPPTPDQLAEITRMFEAADAADAERDHAFVAAVRAARAAAPGDTPCPATYTRNNEEAFADGLARWTSELIAAKQLLHSEDVWVVYREDQLDSLLANGGRRAEEQRLRGREAPYTELDGASLVARAKQLAATPPANELVLWVNSVQRPEQHDADHFAGGGITARAYLYDGKAARVICVADLDVSSSRVVHVLADEGPPTDQDDALHFDLFLHLIQAAERSLKTVR
jgi:hypothetical protein